MTGKGIQSSSFQKLPNLELFTIWPLLYTKVLFCLFNQLKQAATCTQNTWNFFLETLYLQNFISLVCVAAITLSEVLGTYEEIDYLDIPLKCEMYYLKIVFLIFYMISTISIFRLDCLASGRYYEQLSCCLLYAYIYTPILCHTVCLIM